MPLAGVVPPAIEHLVVHVGAKGNQRVDRLNYEICVAPELRVRLRCTEIWVVGADRYRNPDEDLPQDFDVQCDSSHDDLGQPREADAFIAPVKIPQNGRIVVTPLVALSEPVYVGNLKGELVVHWPMTSLLDVLKETDLRVGITPHRWHKLHALPHSLRFHLLE